MSIWETEREMGINIKMNLWETGCEGGVLMELAQYCFQWLASVLLIFYFQVLIMQCFSDCDIFLK